MEVQPLSEVEQDVVSRVAAGRTHREIAAALGLSLKTVEWHSMRAELKLARAAALHERLAARDASHRTAPKEVSR